MWTDFPQLYAIKLDDHYERVRTDEKRIEGEDDETLDLPLALEWHVQLVSTRKNRGHYFCSMEN